VGVVTSVGFVVHEGRAAAVEAANTLRVDLGREGIDCVDGAPAGIALVVTVGGDGTFLRGAPAAAALGVPVLGIKVGRLGFLTEVEPDDAGPLIAQALAGDAPVEDRLAVVAEPMNGASFEGQWGMNEIMIEKGARHRLVRLRVELDGDYLTTFSADGVIVATPTGSTAYSLSAGGPILDPESGVFVITPICPHVLTNRSIIVAEASTIEIEASDPEYPVYLTLDGRKPIHVERGSVVTIRKAKKTLPLASLPDASFFSVVRQKLKWSGSNL
jgi:NAD+ kinase